jgi:hypothetical protein
MSRSDNFPVTGNLVYPCSGSGEVRVWLGFRPKSVVVTPVEVPQGARLFVDPERQEADGFVVQYEGVTDPPGYINFSYMAS